MANAGVYLSEADEDKLLFLKETSDFYCEEHFHSSFQFLFLMNGSLQATINNETFIVKEKQIIFINSYETHFFKKITPDAKGILLILSSDYYALFKSLYNDKLFQTLLNDEGKNTELFDLLNRWIKENKKDFILNYGYANLLFAKILENYSTTRSSNLSEENLLKNILKFIHEHYLEDIKLSSLSKKFGYTIEYCSKILKQATNSNFRDYINKLRFRKANELLDDKNTKLTKLEIMYMCGFTSTATFYRVKTKMSRQAHKIANA